MMLRTLTLALVAFAAPAGAFAQGPTSLTCDLGHVAVSATVDASDGSVLFDDGGKPLKLAGAMTGSRVDFDDGEHPITQSYAIDLNTLRIDRWVATDGEARSHLDSGRCRATVAIAPVATAATADNLRTP